MKKITLIALLISSAYAQNPKQSLLVTTVTGVSTAYVTECSGVAACLDNRSTFLRNNSYHSFTATGTGTWSVQMDYADGSPMGFISFGSTALITNTSNPNIGFANGYHDYIHFTITGGGAASVSITYGGIGSTLFFANQASVVSFPISVGNGGTGLTTATTNTVPYGQGASPFALAGPGIQYQVFQAGASGVPNFGAVNLAQSAAVTGLLPLANGGTNSGTGFGALTNLLGQSVTSAQGTGAKIQTGAGTTTTGDCTKYDSTGAVIDAGAPCGTGSGTSLPWQPTLTWSQTPSGSLSAGSNTITLTPCPTGLNGTDSNHYVYISGPGSPTSIAITSVRPDTTPFQVTTSSPHGLSTGNFVNILCPTVVNSVCGPWIITSTGASTFTLQNSVPVFGFALAYATNASPIVVDWNQKPGLATGDTLTISGVTGNTGANGTFTYTRINDFQGSLQGSTGTGTFTGGTQTITFGAASPSLGGAATVSFGPEADLITGGSCTSAAGSGTITVTTNNAHSSGYTVQSATAGIQEAVVNAQANSLTSIMVPSGTQTVQATALLPTGFKISGASDLSSILQLNPAGTPSIAVLSGLGTAGSATSSSTTVAYSTRATASTRSLTLSSVSGISAGTYLDFLSGADPTYGNVYEEIEVVDSVSGSVVNLKGPLVIPIISGNMVTPLTPVSISVSNLTLDGHSIGLDRPVSFSMVGVQCQYCTQSVFNNLKLINWTGGGGLYVNYGDQITVNGINVVNSGNQNYNDIGLARVTRGNLSNVISQNSAGFGPGWYSAIKSNGTNITTNDPFSRAFKTSECVDSNFSNLSLHGGVHATGLSITNGSYNCNYSNIVAEGFNNVQGVWFSNLDEQWNKVTNVKAYNNSFFGGSFTDIQLFSNDSNNFLSGLDLQNGLSDSGTNNTWSVAVPARSKGTQTGATSMVNNTYTVVVFDTSAYDVGGVHSNTSKFTIPTGQGGFSGGVCALWRITGFLEIVPQSSAVGVVNFKIRKNGSTDVFYGEVNQPPSSASLAGTSFGSGEAALCDGDYIEMLGYQNSGGNLNTIPGTVNTSLQISRAW